MARHAAFLRGINLGRNRRVSGAELCSQFEALGFQGVATFRTSGNVVFEAGREAPAKLADRIEKRLAESLGYHVAVFIRTASRLREIASHEPFPPAMVNASKGKLQVMLLPAKPDTQTLNEVLASATEEDRLAFGDRELYWLPSGLMRDSALDLKSIEKLLGPTTMRTKGTIEQLAAKYFAD
ncbi:MAG TPA: DUF1697 domain-containing protein [Thermoleophilaceae bacterium]|jgi:uncharacterized protein (DUF1697 family)